MLKSSLPSLPGADHTFCFSRYYEITFFFHAPVSVSQPRRLSSGAIQPPLTHRSRASPSAQAAPAHSHYEPAGSEYHHDGGDDSDGEPTERRGYDVPKTRLPLTRLEKGGPLVGGIDHEADSRRKEPLAEANATPVPMRAYDADVHGEGSRPSTDSNKEHRCYRKSNGYDAAFWGSEYSIGHR